MAATNNKTNFNQKAASPKAAKKMNWKKWAAIGGGVFLLLIVGVFFFPYYGTVKYGVCRTYVELQEPYPSEIQFIHAVEDSYSNTVVISYKKIDPFGLEAMNDIQCTFEGTPYVDLKITKIDINGRKRTYPQEDPEIIRKFNMTIPSIEANPGSLVMPYLLSNDIKDYR